MKYRCPAFIVWLLLLLLLAMAVSSGSQISSKEQEIEDLESLLQDTKTDYEYRCADMYNEGYEAGCDKGYDDGYFDGNSDGYSEGYAEGQDSGYYSGAIYTCLFFDDVERAFKCAVNGGSWHTFVDAYDEYISDIYHTDDERLEIVWSLIAWDCAVSDSNPELTQEERNILLSTFGYELFLANGFDIRNK